LGIRGKIHGLKAEKRFETRGYGYIGEKFVAARYGTSHGHNGMLPSSGALEISDPIRKEILF
jgi:hypothetical protein